MSEMIKRDFLYVATPGFQFNPPPDRLARNFASLVNTLNIAFGGPTKSGVADSSMHWQDRYALALADYAKFLAACDIEDKIARRFSDLANAIFALRNGKVANLLRPAAGGGGPDLYATWEMRNNVCIGLECLIKAEMGRGEAAEHIENNYPDFKRLKHRKSATLVSSILSWRWRINKRDVPAGDVFLAHQREFFEARRGLSPEEWRAVGEELLEETATLVRQSAI